MNKTKKISRLGLLLAALFAVTLTLASCAQKDDGDYFSSSEIGWTYNWNANYKNIPTYRYETFEKSFLDETSTNGFIVVIDCQFTEQKDYWKYIVYLQLQYLNDEGKTTDWADRKVFVKTKTQALKVYGELLARKDELIRGNNSNMFGAYYGIDYYPDILMSNTPIVYDVQNMNGDTFSKNEVMYSFYDSSKKVNRKVFEERNVYNYFDGNEIQNSFFQIETLDDPDAPAWKYFVHFHTNWYDADGNWQRYIGREVYCKKKSEAKKVLKDMMDSYKQNPELFISLNPTDNERYIGQSFGYDYNLSTLIK